MKVLGIVNYISAACVLVLVALTWVLAIPEGEFQGPIDLATLSMVAVNCAALCAIIVCIQWRHPKPLLKLMRSMSVIVLLFALAFVVMLVVHFVSSGTGGANIGLGLIGLCIHLFGFINALAILLSSVLGKLPAARRRNRQLA
ncbi:hypothetical protein [Corynebacterium sp.]|uniref:hypothetical protein n=1 Tax=Corynebacterium sp. TaxID=1720 RepID=UPI0026DCA5B4|nr:hypothetical protein [Corynebacterium sp.]MDO5077282.1 hypothetical protein [Corynebacterium sp.]